MNANITSTVAKDDFEASLRDAIEGKPIDADAERRIQERAMEITERLRRVHGVVDDATFEMLLEDE